MNELDACNCRRCAVSRSLSQRCKKLVDGEDNNNNVTYNEPVKFLGNSKYGGYVERKVPHNGYNNSHDVGGAVYDRMEGTTYNNNHSHDSRTSQSSGDYSGGGIHMPNFQKKTSSLLRSLPKISKKIESLLSASTSGYNWGTDNSVSSSNTYPYETESNSSSLHPNTLRSTTLRVPSRASTVKSSSSTQSSTPRTGSGGVSRASTPLTGNRGDIRANNTPNGDVRVSVPSSRDSQKNISRISPAESRSRAASCASSMITGSSEVLINRSLTQSTGNDSMYDGGVLSKSAQYYPYKQQQQTITIKLLDGHSLTRKTSAATKSDYTFTNSSDGYQSNSTLLGNRSANMDNDVQRYLKFMQNSIDSKVHYHSVEEEVQQHRLTGQRSQSIGSISSRNSTYYGRHQNICNVFWKVGLVCSNYTYGDRPLEFETFWPTTEQMDSLLWEAYCSSSLKKCVLDLCRISICCGPVTLLKSLLTLNIIGVNTKLENGSTLLHLSCIANNAQTTSLLCSRGVNKQIPDKQGRTALQVCYHPVVSSLLMPPTSVTAATGMMTAPSRLSSTTKKKMSPTLYDKEILFEMATSCTEVDELLLKLQTYQFDINKEVNENGDFLLHAAVREGLCQLPLIMQLVKQFGADINLQNSAGQSPLMISAEIGDNVLSDVLLCVTGVDPDVQNPDSGYTALHYSCLNNHVDNVNTLLKRGADFNKEDKVNMRPDDVAISFGHMDCSDLIRIHRKDRMSVLNNLVQEDKLTSDTLKETDLCTTDPETGFTLLMLSAKLNKLKSMRLLLSYSNVPVNAQHEKTMQTSLSFAADEGNIEAMNILMEAESNPSILDIERLIAIHHAVRNNHVDFVRCLLQHNGTLLGLELSLKMSNTEDMKKVIRSAMNRRQREIVSPLLFECSMSGDAEKLYCTLEEGDCINPVSGMGLWPLYLAVENQHMDVIRLLCDNGADLTRRYSSTGNTVLHLSCSRGFYDITLFLLKSYLREWSVVSRDPTQIIHLMNYDGKTALVLAAEQGHSKLVALLLQHGASSSVLNQHGELYTCHQYEGCQSLIEKNRGHHGKLVFSALIMKDGIKKLKQVFLPRFDQNLRDEKGNTPLMVACRNQNTAMIKFLLESSVYVLEHSKNFYGSFTRTFVSNRSGSDSGKHTSLEHTNTPQQCQCAGNQGQPTGNQDNTKSGFYDSVVGLDSLERCKFCLGNSEENLCSLINSSHSNQHLATTDKAECLTVPTAERCSCNKCSTDSHKSGSNTEGIVHNSNTHLDSILRKNNPMEESLPEDEEYEQQIQDNMSALFTSITSVNNRGSIFVTEIMVSHLCAISLHDGATCFHRLIEGGDNVTLLELLLETDHNGVNIQDNLGQSPLHLACHMSRKKIVNKLTSLPYVDLNCRTLDGKLPEEMTTDKNIHRIVLRARGQEPPKSVLSPLMSLSQSVFGVGSYATMDANSVDFEQTNAQFMMIKEQFHQNHNYVDESTMMMTSVHF